MAFFTHKNILNKIHYVNILNTGIANNKRAYSKINNCRVVIDLAKNNTHKDKLYRVSINITIPGKELISKKQDSNLFIVIRDSFLAIEKLLEKHHKKNFLFNKSYSNYLRKLV